MNIFFTADNHFFHKNIIEYCNRPFKSLEGMNLIMIRNWNSRVKKEDMIFIIGDFIFTNTLGGKAGEGEKINVKEFVSQLNGNKIFIEGNHCRNNRINSHIQKLVLDYGGNKINLVHNPEHADYRYIINLTGHIHEKWEIKRYRYGALFTDCINVGVDVWNFMPINWEEINKRYSKWLKLNNLDITKQK
jgi:calcineurin-like phosphoesterase family protein